MHTHDTMVKSCNPQGRDPLWDNLKLLAMVCIIFRHSILQYSASWYPYVWTPMMFAMPAFCFVSGRMFRQRTIVDSAKSYLWPCMLFTVLLWGWGQLFYPPMKGRLPEAIIVGPAMWYLLALFFWQIITPYILRFNIWAVLATSIVVGCLAGFVPWIGIEFQVSRLICFYPYFILGIATKQWSPSVRTHRNQWLLWGAAFCVLCLTYYLLHIRYPRLVFQVVMNKGYPISYRWPIIRLFTYTMGIAMTFCIINILSSIGDIRLPILGRVSRFGARTMSPYLLHEFVVMPICYTLAMPHLYEPIGYFLTILAAPLLCILMFGKTPSRIVDKMLHPSFRRH